MAARGGAQPSPAPVNSSNPHQSDARRWCDVVRSKTGGPKGVEPPANRTHTSGRHAGRARQEPAFRSKRGRRVAKATNRSRRTSQRAAYARWASGSDATGKEVAGLTHARHRSCRSRPIPEWHRIQAALSQRRAAARDGSYFAFAPRRCQRYGIAPATSKGAHRHRARRTTGSPDGTPSAYIERAPKEERLFRA